MRSNGISFSHSLLLFHAETVEEKAFKAQSTTKLYNCRGHVDLGLAFQIHIVTHNIAAVQEGPNGSCVSPKIFMCATHRDGAKQVTDSRISLFHRRVATLSNALCVKSH